jgi:predicted regulator of Ras-like GTPase activity (Roadblock/LC7/MglB family)
MPFLRWFKRKSENIEAEAESNLADKLTTTPAKTTETVETSDNVPVTPLPRNVPKPMESPPAEELIGLRETEVTLPNVTADSVARVDADGPTAGTEEKIRLRLQSILSDFPLDLEHPSMHSLSGTDAEIELPRELIQSQLARGRVVVPGDIFCRALPEDLRPYFEAINPTAEIPIPLQEIFSRLPPDAIRIREDQEMDRPEETIPTPFRGHAEEDAKRLRQVSAAPTNEPLQPARIAVQSDLKTLQALFMTDEPLDLAKTVDKVAGLPSIRSCILNTIDGLKLAGDLGDPGREQAISALLPDVFQKTRSKLDELQVGTLESITLSYGIDQLSTFVQGNLCLTVLHDKRPFKPGVREKIHAVLSELVTLGNSEKAL